ncbi:hypothetical protein D9756_006976 [Leucocoprinus leucothites]|uniref:DUF4246 domain-containing protein n=1 Tax=Leucocoprinus leucothites TaxID=201217 RepID=A0A8H5FYP1_9AGAR|nr:hypothetical protein D9756_006976 [Leucoagaricus leucothites]
MSHALDYRTPHSGQFETDDEEDALGNEESSFVTALNPTRGSERRRTTIRSTPPLLRVKELAMCQFMNGITDVQYWAVWVENIGFVNRKTTELLSCSRPKFSEWMARYYFAELRHTARMPKLKPDGILLVSILKSITEHRKDLLGNDRTSVLLINPTLHPLIFGTTRVLQKSLISRESCIKRSGSGEIIAAPNGAGQAGSTDEDNSWYEGEIFSKKFQWLPCEVDRRITNYTNSLYPQEHHQLYACLEEIIGKVIPFWNTVLTPLRNHSYRRWKGPFDLNDPCGFEDTLEEDSDKVDLVLEYAETGLQVIVDLKSG